MFSDKQKFLTIVSICPEKYIKFIPTPDSMLE